MATVIDGTTGVNRIQDGIIVQADLASPFYLPSNAQTWQDVTGSRVSNTTYTNSTNLPIQVSAYSTGTSGGVSSISIQVGALVVSYNYSPAIAASTFATNASAIVPAGETYKVVWVGTASIKEFR